MGFFSKLFKKKRGGSFFGNLIRGVANKATGGILGSGAQLQKREEQFQARAAKEAEEQAYKNFKSTKSFNLGSQVGNQLEPHVAKFTEDSDAAKKLQNKQVKAWLTRNWWKVAIPVVLVIAGIFLFKGKRKTKGGLA
ncbi:hypothetical protein A9Q86_02210 [Flavobacteriales bacterium 33_180_T64]|nr:hypothetical protein A9Q86_02210 [Flavobacteriales bacterium 33_180_T64]